jgi:nitrite reductase/ring-hydroxylating ferredoxin subunit
MAIESRSPQPDAEVSSDRVSRRTVIRCAAAASALAAAGISLAGCGSDEPAETTGGGAPQPEAGTTTGKTSPGNGGGGGGGGAAGALASTSDIPVGGGKVVKDGGDSIIVMQPSEGKFTALSAKCTHQGGPVGAPKDGVLTCPWHGSEFDEDGSVKNGPASAPLEKIDVEVKGDSVVRA